jgi:tRNA A37 threonylcarbamoyladenosine biosynthesis protein TsaE
MVETLPFVNREEALEKAARVLLRNQLLTDQTKKHLVIYEQLFGAGKTTFANVLGEGLRAGFGGRMLLK